jgi:hypothetical protein
MSVAELTETLTGSALTTSDLRWIERQLPLIKEPFARLLLLVTLLDARRQRSGNCNTFATSRARKIRRNPPTCLLSQATSPE